MKRLIVLLLSFIPFLSLSAQTLPRDGETVWLWEIEEVELPEAGEAASVWDLRNAVKTGEVERTYRLYGDTLVGRTTGRVRDWFLVSGDSVKYLGCNNLSSMLASAVRPPYLVLSYLGANGEFPDSLSHEQTGAVPYSTSATWGMETEFGATILLPPNDTVKATVAVRTWATDTVAVDDLGTMAAIRVESRRWYAQGSVLPVVEKTRQSVTVADSTACTSRMLVCPDAAASEVATTSRSLSSRSAAATEEGAPALPMDAYAIATEPGTLAVSMADGYPAGDITVHDAQGRLWLAGLAGTALSTSSLPPGQYLVTVRVGQRSSTRAVDIR